MKTLAPLVIALALAGCGQFRTYDPAAWTPASVPAGPEYGNSTYPEHSVEVEAWAAPNEEFVIVDDWYEDSTTVEYWTDDGGAYYGGIYYSGAVFVAGTWADSYFPYDGCHVPGGVLLNVARPRDARIPWRAYHGHAGRNRTGYDVLEDRRSPRDRDHRGVVQVRRRNVPVQSRPAAPADRRTPRVDAPRPILPATSRIAPASAARDRAQRVAAEESQRRARTEQAARQTRERNTRVQAERAAADNARRRAAEQNQRRIRAEQTVSETRERNTRVQAQRAAAENARRQAAEETPRRSRDEAQQRSRVEQDTRRREEAKRPARENPPQGDLRGGRARR